METGNIKNINQRRDEIEEIMAETSFRKKAFSVIILTLMIPFWIFTIKQNFDNQIIHFFIKITFTVYMFVSFIALMMIINQLFKNFFTVLNSEIIAYKLIIWYDEKEDGFLSTILPRNYFPNAFFQKNNLAISVYLSIGLNGIFNSSHIVHRYAGTKKRLIIKKTSDFIFNIWYLIDMKIKHHWNQRAEPVYMVYFLQIATLFNSFNFYSIDFLRNAVNYKSDETKKYENLLNNVIVFLHSISVPEIINGNPMLESKRNDLVRLLTYISPKSKEAFVFLGCTVKSTSNSQNFVSKYFINLEAAVSYYRKKVRDLLDLDEGEEVELQIFNPYNDKEILKRVLYIAPKKK